MSEPTSPPSIGTAANLRQHYSLDGNAVRGLSIIADEETAESLARITDYPFQEMAAWLQQELRSNHAGEFGAVMIYRGILSVTKDDVVKDFSERHLDTELQHLSMFEELIPAKKRTRLLPLWKIMGWITGALPALFGRNTVFATIEAVESFVDQHYKQQIDRLEETASHIALKRFLVDCQSDEVCHRDEASSLQVQNRGLILKLWCKLIGLGSVFAVTVARRL